MNNIKAAIFDFDGTVTKKGIPILEDDMLEALVSLAKKMPIAFCTGRNLESFVRRGLDKFMAFLKADERDEVLKNVYLLAENGAVGYFYSTDKHDFEEFYCTDWPDSIVSMDKLKKELSEKVREWGELFENAHKAVVVYRTVLYDIDNRDVNEVYELSHKIYEAAVEYLRGIDKDYEEHLHVGDSGIGVLIIPADGDKDAGIRQFAKYLEDKFGTTFGDNIKDIMVTGDRPQKGGNDFYLLNSGIGTAYTVGDLGEGEHPPTPVIDENGDRILNNKGTLHLIKKVLK